MHTVKGSLHTRSSSRLHLSVFKILIISAKTAFAGLKNFRGFRETGPWEALGLILGHFFSV